LETETWVKDETTGDTFEKPQLQFIDEAITPVKKVETKQVEVASGWFNENGEYVKDVEEQIFVKDESTGDTFKKPQLQFID
jgi:hypothetical protein